MNLARGRFDDIPDRLDPGENIMKPLAFYPRLLIVQDEDEASRLRKQEPNQDEQDELALQASWQKARHRRSTTPTNL